ncbi:MAG: aminodeoxychorismate/anthranilate synthase component II [Thaumarchaeota archaeon]|nr:MAG: aminodeoxychorismate/anthranilate synthase component II [Nitrososphaerota archaeon]
MKKILIIDNYDSFVYNIAQLFGKLSTEPVVIRNDKLSINDIKKLQPDGIVLSPGPGHPSDKKSFGICGDVIERIGPSIPVLGVCLGHQGIVHVYGGNVINARVVRHGKTSEIGYMDNELFRKLANPFVATRYHSLVASRDNFPACLEVTAISLDDQEIMGLKHKKYPIYGVQFHPESVLTKNGYHILENFIDILKR